MTRPLLVLLVLHACAGPSAPSASAPPAASMTIPSPVPSASPAASASSGPPSARVAPPAPASSSTVAPAAPRIDADYMGVSSPFTKPTDDVDAGAPSLARTIAGDQYVTKFAEFIRRRMPKPPAHACVTFQINVGKTMRIWHVRSTPVRPSGDDAFDAAVRAGLEKLIEDKVALPEPPPELADQYRGRTITLRIGEPDCR